MLANDFQRIISRRKATEIQINRKPFARATIRKCLLTKLKARDRFATACGTENYHLAHVAREPCFEYRFEVGGLLTPDVLTIELKKRSDLLLLPEQPLVSGVL